MAKCKEDGCNIKIIWMKTKNDKWMPVDFSSLSDADLRYLQLIDAEKNPIQFRYGEHISHYVTCKSPNKFRKEKLDEHRTN